MPWRSQQTWELILLMVALTMGMMGGAVVAGSHLVQRKLDRFAVAISYVIIGAGFGAGSLLLSPLLPMVEINGLWDAAAFSLAASVVGVSMVAAGNFGFAIVLKQLGVRVRVEMLDRHGKRWENERKGKDDASD